MSDASAPIPMLNRWRHRLWRSLSTAPTAGDRCRHGARQQLRHPMATGDAAPSTRSPHCRLASCAVSASSMSRRASAMSARRFARSFWRHRRRSVRIDWGRRAGQTRPVGVFRQDERQRVRDFVGGERAHTGQQLVEHAAECPDVGALVHVLATRLFWRHVRRRPEDHPDAGHRGRRHRRRHRLRVTRRLGAVHFVHAFARPKSRTFTRSSGVTLMLAGFRSRCTTPLDAPRRARRQSVSRSAAPGRWAGRRAPAGRRVSLLAPARARGT